MHIGTWWQTGRKILLKCGAIISSHLSNDPPTALIVSKPPPSSRHSSVVAAKAAKNVFQIGPKRCCCYLIFSQFAFLTLLQTLWRSREALHPYSIPQASLEQSCDPSPPPQEVRSPIPPQTGSCSYPLGPRYQHGSRCRPWTRPIDQKGISWLSLWGTRLPPGRCPCSRRWADPHPQSSHQHLLDPHGDIWIVKTHASKCQIDKNTSNWAWQIPPEPVPEPAFCILSKSLLGSLLVSCNCCHIVAPVFRSLDSVPLIIQL